MKISRTVRLDRSTDEVFAYMRDFTTTEEWDPGTVSTTLVEGDGGVGSRYRNVSRFLGRETELEYVVVDEKPGSFVHLRGENSSVVADDEISVRKAEDGATELTYEANFQFKGLAKWLAPLTAPALKQLGDKAEEGLRRALA